MFRTATTALVTSFFAAAPGFAEPRPFTLDLGHAYVGFEIEHMGFARTVGQFRSFDGAFLIDEAAPENSKISFVVDVASLDSNHPARDAHVLNPDFLDVEKHPTMMFESTGVTMLTPTRGKLHGELTLLGVTKPLTLDFTMVQDRTYPAFIPNYDEIRAVGFEVEGAVLRLDHGMDGVSFLGSPVGREVKVKAYFDLVDCDGAADTNVPCTYGRDQ